MAQPNATAPKIGNPAVVGLAGFGLTTFVLQLHNIGLCGIGPVIWLGFFFGGLAQFIAGYQEQKMGNNFGYCAFTAYGAFWISLCAMIVAGKFDLFTASKTDVGYFLIAWTLFSFILFIGSTKVHMAMFLTFLTLMIGFVLLDLAHFGYPELTVYAGYDLMACALLAWYMMAHVIFLDLFGRDVLPVGKPLF
ncbi:MAG TPA: acetate uptake transporter [Rhodospirillaceae bacterium]|nr:acetate uptake transporter [Rhodospirillaceae bacterium]